MATSCSHTATSSSVSTTVFNRSEFPDWEPVHTSFLQRAPGLRSRYRSYLPLVPVAIEELDLTGYERVFYP